MKLKEDSVRYLTKTEVEAFKEEEHRERVALSQRVARGELTPRQANEEAAFIKDPQQARLLNLGEHLDAMARLHPVSYVRSTPKHNGRRRKKTVRTS